jgi:hypothetical protein
VADPIGPGGAGGAGGRRLLAVAGAVVLVVVALVVRGRLDDSGGGGNDGTSTNGGHTLICPPDLADACQAAVAADDDLQVRTQDPLTTANALIAATSSQPVEGDLWLVPAPWAQAVAAQRHRDRHAAVTGKPSSPIARSPVVLAMWDDRAAALEQSRCHGQIKWKCVGDAAGRQWTESGGPADWGTAKAGLTDPTTAMGLPVLGGAAAGYLGRNDYSSNDFGGGLLGWLAALAAYPADSDGVDVMITQGAGSFFAVGALEATARVAAGNPELRVVVPQPVATADLVAVPIGANAGNGGSADDLAGNGGLLDALAGAGWRVDGHDLARGVDADLKLPAKSNLPSGDVLFPLLQSWQQLG